MDSDFLIPVFLFPMIGFIVWVMVTNARRLRMARLQMEMQSKLLERIGSNQELMQYLESDNGRRLLESATAERGNPYGRILGSMQAGVVLGLVGVAFLFLRGEVSDAQEGFSVIGALALALGLGFLISAVASFMLSKSWGLINGDAAAQR